MNSGNEVAFREIEQQLDQLVHVARPELTAGGIAVADESVRQYHREPLLSWQFRFETRQECGSEIAKVWLTLTLTEDRLNVCRLWRRAELFQIGQLSRWQNTHQCEFPVKRLREAGLASVVLSSIREGETLLGEFVGHNRE